MTPERVTQNITTEAVDVRRSLFQMPPELQEEVYRRLNFNESFNLAKTLFFSKRDASLAFVQMLGHDDLVPFLQNLLTTLNKYRKPHLFLPGRVLNVISSVICITKMPIKVLKLNGLFEHEKIGMEKFESLRSRIKKAPLVGFQIDVLTVFL